MNRIQVLKIANHIILALSIIGYFSLWQDSNSNDYIKSTVLAGLVISIFVWFFVLTFCDNAEDSKEILSLLKGENIQKTDKQKEKENKKITNENEIIDIEGMKQSVSSNELIIVELRLRISPDIVKGEEDKEILEDKSKPIADISYVSATYGV